MFIDLLNLEQCDGLIMRCKILTARELVARDGVEPRDASLFSVFFGPKPFFSQPLNSSRWPIYCDHSVTSADVRL